MRAWLSPRSPKSPERPRSTWAGRLRRGRRLDRNPLRRRSDRAETVMLGVLLTAFLAGAPFAAHAAGNWTHATFTREAQAQQDSIHQVPATLLQAAPLLNMTAYGAEAQARWRAPDGQARTGLVFAPSDAAAGSTVMIWTDQAGQLSDSPLQSGQVIGRMYLSEVLAVAALAVALIIVGAASRRVLDRRRLAAWDTDWLATEPRWSPRQ